MRKFMRTRGAAPQPPPLPLARDTLKPNGHANGAAGARRDDQRSTLSRYWSGSDESGAARALWEDVEFPAGDSALGERRGARSVRWLRPHELCARPRFLGDAALEGEGGAEAAAGETGAGEEERGAARWRAETGEAGLAALCCAAAALADTPRLLARAAPPHSFRRRYTGAFRFQFWVFGAWREVCVDDRLPVQLGLRGPRLLASRSALPDDFTLPLLEKAYAKLYGSYAAARASSGGAGGVARALQELSGGVVQSFAPPRQPRALLLQVLHSAVPRSTLLVATVPGASSDKETGTRRLRNGLIVEQAYLVTGLARVRDAGGGASGETEGGGALVRLRAPAGRGEWIGAWARGSPEWCALASADRELLAHRTDRPGHFWMAFADFASAFGRLELVHVGPDDWLSEPALHGKRPWRAVVARRRWRAGYNAGGPPGGRTAHANPQFQLNVARGTAGRCHAVVSVTQRYAPGRAARLPGIGFALYELPAAGPPRRAPLVADLQDLRALDVTHESRAREVATFFTLPPGRYLLLPYTARPHVETAFLLRVLTDEHTDVWEVNDDNVVVRDVSTELADADRAMPARVQAALRRLMGKWEGEEVDAGGVRAALRAAGGWALAAAPSRELAAALVALRDPAAGGRLAARELPALLALLALWRAAWGRAARCGGASAYGLRALLWACGVRASNKVLECVVLRYAERARLRPERFVLALARLHLAHERYRILDSKLKSNPLSLEEMILMTIYS